MENKQIKNNIKLMLIIGIPMILIISVIGYTYSFFAAEAKDEVTIRGEVASINLGLTVTRVAPEQDKELIPQLDSTIAKAAIGTRGNCLDDNNNAICQVYKITVQNIGSIATYVNGTLELNVKNNSNLRWAEISGLSNTTLMSSVNTYADTVITTSELYEAGDSKDYYIVIWISETGAAQTDSGSFSGVVTFGGLSSNAALATLTSLDITAEDNTYTTFTATSEADGTTGVYETEDDLGTSYYFRGNVTNNYVKFADYYWRIVRINGDGSIRMIYDGTQAYANGTSSTDRQIGTSVFNTTYADNAFVGYMNGTTNGTNFPSGGTNSTSYAEAHANRTNSTIKTYIDNWYKTNIVDKGYSKYVVDAIYCNDRKVTTNQGFINIFNATSGFTVTNDGFGGKVTLYGFYDKVDANAYLEGSMNFTPTLKCAQENDRFTTEATVGRVTGNGALEYPVGLITSDEVAFAGGHADSNTSYYLYTGDRYWTASPSACGGGWADGFIVNSDGNASDSRSVEGSNGVRPVISISSTAITGGTGTTTDPFIVG